MAKTIFILLDAGGYDVVSENGGFLEHMIEAGKGAKYRVRGELPSMSRPMYATVTTGTPASVHGVVNNNVVRPMELPSVFSLCREHGLTTAAAAYHWFSELYARCPFQSQTDRYQLDGKGQIQYGVYYFEDQYPDSHLFLDAEMLRTTYDPDFLLIHPMNIDYWGHKKGSDSAEYQLAAQNAQEIVSGYLLDWLNKGYAVVVTADHGMNQLGLHGGPTPMQRDVPLYLFGCDCKSGDFTDYEISQRNIAPLLCKLLGLPKTKYMINTLEIE